MLLCCSDCLQFKWKPAVSIIIQYGVAPKRISGALLSGRSLKKEVPPTTRRCNPTALGVRTVWQPLRELDSHPGKPLDRRPPKEAAGRSSPTFSWIERFGTWTLNSSINRPLIVSSVSHSLTTYGVKGASSTFLACVDTPWSGLVWSTSVFGSAKRATRYPIPTRSQVPVLHPRSSSDNPIRYLKVTG